MADVILPCRIYDIHTYRRYYRWIKFMDKYIKPYLGYNRIILLDNASDLKFLKKLKATIHTENNECLAVGRSDLFVYRYETYYARVGHLGYSYYWRAVYQLPKFKGTFYQSDKYYWIDSDVYIVKSEFIDHIKLQNTGFIRYADRHHNWGESILMTINKDSFHLLEEHDRVNGGFLNRNDEAETTLPKTLMDNTFNGGRFPEAGKQQDDSMYWIGQVPRGYKVKFHV